ncbi:MAG: hypothetical protein ABI723_20215 [Bacteroidia bacterium]
MPLLDLDKIIIQKTIIGVNCVACGGNLKHINKRSFTAKVITAFTFGKIKAKLYQCETCNKFYTVI